jgi:hypothetical protein
LKWRNLVLSKFILLLTIFASTSLSLSIAQTQSLLTNFLNDTQSQDNLLTAFGDEFDTTTGLTLLQTLVTCG